MPLLPFARAASDRLFWAARGLLGNPGNTLAGVQRRPDVGRCDPGGGPQHQQVVEQVGGLGDDAVTAPACALDHGLNRLLADLLGALRSEEHTSDLQSLMRISYAAFCLKKTT